MQPFVHLHSHTEFSLLDGISRLPDMVRRAKELNQPDRKSTRLNSSHIQKYRMPSSA